MMITIYSATQHSATEHNRKETVNERHIFSIQYTNVQKQCMLRQLDVKMTVDCTQ